MCRSSPRIRAQRVFGDSSRGVRRHPHGDRGRCSGRQVDIVEAGTAQRDHTDPQLVEALYRCRVDVIVDEHAHGVAPGGEFRCAGVEADVEVFEMVTAQAVAFVERRSVVPFGTEQQHAHPTSVAAALGIRVTSTVM